MRWAFLIDKIAYSVYHIDMDIIGDVFKMLGTVLAEIFGGLGKVLPKLLHFLFWFLAGIFILPCVFVSAQWYPKWQKWGEKF